MTEDLVKRMRATERSGQYTIGGGNISADGKAETWGGDPIMVYRNPDGPEAADLIERLTTPQAGEVERVAALFCDAFTNGNAQLADVPEHHREAFMEGARNVLSAAPNAGLVEALKPFAALADFYNDCEQHPGGCPDDASVGEAVDVTVGDLRRAKSALDALRGG